MVSTVGTDPSRIFSFNSGSSNVSASTRLGESISGSIGPPDSAGR